MLQRLSRFVRSIRFRLTLIYTSLLSVVLLGFSLSLVAVFSNSFFWQADTSLSTEAQLLQRPLKLAVAVIPDLATTPKARDSVAQFIAFAVRDSEQQSAKLYSLAFMVTDRTGQPLLDKTAQAPGIAGSACLHSPLALSARTAAAQQGKPSTLHTDVHGQVCQILSVPVSNGQDMVILQVARGISGLQDTLDTVFLYMKISIPMALILTALLGWYLAGRALAPVEKIRRLASEISISDLSQRLNLKGNDELAHLAETFDSMIDRLGQSVIRQKQFTSDASHELRTPLAIMQADFSYALRRSRSEAEYETILISAQEEIVRMTRIVDGLSFLARMDAAVVVLNLLPVALEHLLSDLVSRIDVLAAEKDVMIVTSGLLPLAALADEHLLKQLFLNLLNNAITYTPQGGRITVSMSSVSDDICAVHVADTGIGIPSAALPHIFDRFYRVDASRQRHAGGSGLGLAICQSIVQAHGGSLTVESVEGRGSTFTVTLPLSSLASAAARPTPDVAASSPILSGPLLMS